MKRVIDLTLFWLEKSSFLRIYMNSCNEGQNYCSWMRALCKLLVTQYDKLLANFFD